MAARVENTLEYEQQNRIVGIKIDLDPFVTGRGEANNFLPVGHDGER